MKITWSDRWSRCAMWAAVIFAVVCMILGSPLSNAQEPNAKEPLTLNGHINRVYGVTFSPNGKRLATASSDKTIKVWDAALIETAFNIPIAAANFAGVVAQVRPFFVELLTWSRDSWPIPLWSFPLVWLGPAVLAAWATSWLSGRQGQGFARGARMGVGAAVLVGVFGCVTPIVALSPLVGAFVAVVAVLRSG